MISRKIFFNSRVEKSSPESCKIPSVKNISGDTCQNRFAPTSPTPPARPSRYPSQSKPQFPSSSKAANLHHLPSKKVILPRHNAFHGFQKSSLALLDRRNKPGCGVQFMFDKSYRFLHVLLLLVAFGIGLQHLLK